MRHVMKYRDCYYASPETLMHFLSDGSHQNIVWPDEGTFVHNYWKFHDTNVKPVKLTHEIAIMILNYINYSNNPSKNDIFTTRENFLSTIDKFTGFV
jgi:hypothetical protein